MKFLNTSLLLLFLASAVTEAKVAINTTNAYITDLNQEETALLPALTQKEKEDIADLYNNVLFHASRLYTEKLSSNKKRMVAYNIVELINTNINVFSIAIDHKEDIDQIGAMSKVIVDTTIKAVKYKPRTKHYTKKKSWKWKYITLQLPQNGCKIMHVLVNKK